MHHACRSIDDRPYRNARKSPLTSPRGGCSDLPQANMVE